MKNIVTKKLLLGAVVLPALFSGAAMADHATADQPKGYASDRRGEVAINSWGECWRTSYWTPAMATYECDPELLPKPVKVVEVPVVVVTPPPPPPPPPVTAPEKVSLSADELFDFDKAVLRPKGKEKLDELVAKLQDVKYDTIVAIGYADRIGPEKYNLKLSQRRAESVKEYLVQEKGIPAEKIFTDGKGEANPVTTNDCTGNKVTKKLIECLQPDRRVEVEVAGTREVVR